MATSLGEWLNQRSQASRSGEETLKIMRSTRCTKNGIDTTILAESFKTSIILELFFFFNQKETEPEQCLLI